MSFGGEGCRGAQGEQRKGAAKQGGESDLGADHMDRVLSLQVAMQINQHAFAQSRPEEAG